VSPPFLLVSTRRLCRSLAAPFYRQYCVSLYRADIFFELSFFSFFLPNPIASQEIVCPPFLFSPFLWRLTLLVFPPFPFHPISSGDPNLARIQSPYFLIPCHSPLFLFFFSPIIQFRSVCGLVYEFSPQTLSLVFETPVFQGPLPLNGLIFNPSYFFHPHPLLIRVSPPLFRNSFVAVFRVFCGNCPMVFLDLSSHVLSLAFFFRH